MSTPIGTRRARRAGASLVLVTHDVNIRAVTGVNTAPAEIVVLGLQAGGFRVAGRIPP